MPLLAGRMSDGLFMGIGRDQEIMVSKEERRPGKRPFQEAINQEWVEREWRLVRSLKTFRFWALTAVMFTLGIGNGTIMSHLVAMAADMGRSQEMAQNAETCLRNFYASDIYGSLKSHGKEGWLEVEEFSFFHLDSIKINVIIDCAVKEGNSIIIYDWKTGQDLSEDLSVQLCCYAFYAMEKWHLLPDSLQVIEYNLLSNRANSFTATMAEVEGIKGYIKESVKDMQSLLNRCINFC